MMPRRPTTERKRLYTMNIEPDLLAALREISTRDGVPVSEQLRRGARLWLRAWKRARGRGPTVKVGALGSRLGPLRGDVMPPRDRRGR